MKKTVFEEKDYEFYFEERKQNFVIAIVEYTRVKSPYFAPAFRLL